MSSYDRASDRPRIIVKSLHKLFHNDNTLCDKYCKIFGEDCGYCKSILSIHTTSIDHVKPKAHGGENSGNMILACKKCNSLKGSNSLDDWYPKQKFYCPQRHDLIKEWIGEKKRMEERKAEEKKRMEERKAEKTKRMEEDKERKAEKRKRMEKEDKERKADKRKRMQRKEEERKRKEEERNGFSTFCVSIREYAKLMVKTDMMLKISNKDINKIATAKWKLLNNEAKTPYIVMAQCHQERIRLPSVPYCMEKWFRSKMEEEKKRKKEILLSKIRSIQNKVRIRKEIAKCSKCWPEEGWYCETHSRWPLLQLSTWELT